MTHSSSDEADADYLARPAHQVDAPDRYTDWRAYAFSSAPELLDADPKDVVPTKVNPTV